MTAKEEKRKIKKMKRQKTPGILYLSRIPPQMGVTHVRNILGTYGDIGKIFLQPDDIMHADSVLTEGMQQGNSKRRKRFTEGWVEFLDKKIAKGVAFTLNGNKIGGKRKSRWYEELWTMKYLPKFKWAHLNERLEYEKMVRRQKIQTEVRQVKKEMDYYKSSVEHNKIETKIQKRWDKKSKLREKFANEFEIQNDTLTPSEKETQKSDSIFIEVSQKPSQNSTESAHSATKLRRENDREWTFHQTETEEQIAQKKRKRKDEGMERKKKLRTGVAKKAADDKTFLKSLFSGGLKKKDSDQAL